VEFQFLDGPVAAVGAFMNYGLDNIGGPPAGGDPLIATLDANGNIIDQFDVFQLAPIFTLFKANEGAFRGIVHHKNDIAAVRFSNAYLVLDDLTFGRVVPEPSTAALLVLGCVVALVARRR
jgi:PEP-CTERM motif